MARRPSSEVRRIARLRGSYEMCALLLTSPRFNRPQREVIEEQAHLVRGQLEALGITFDHAPDSPSRRAA